MAVTNPGPAITGNPVPMSAIGNVQKFAVIGTVSITPAAIAANTTAQQTFTASGLGLLPGDYAEILALPGSFQAGLVYMPTNIVTADALLVTFGNLTASPITPNAGSYTIRVIRLEPNTVNAAGSGYMNNI
jgi:hypothetical protein